VNKLVETIRSCVKPYPKPAVNISGGIDSAIVLHHLSEKCKEPIYTYTVALEEQDNEWTHGQQLAEHYGTIHKQVKIENMLERYPEILVFMDRPRYNLWPYWVAEQQTKDGIENVYIGEGGDEHFGGYWYKQPTSYPEQWTHLFQYVDPTYEQIYNHFRISLHKPLHPSNLRFTVTYPYYDWDQEKKLVRDAYAGLLPDFVLNRRKLNGRKDYWKLWNQELKHQFKNVTPRSVEDIQELWNLWVTRIWLRQRDAAINETILQRC
jgi:asparagine synthetase B (glutamine-hydrolysing)